MKKTKQLKFTKPVENTIKYSKQILIIAVITMLAYLLHDHIPVKLPASIYGIILLFIALSTKIIKLDDIKEIGNVLILIMPLLIVTMGVGLIDTWVDLQSFLIPAIVIAILTTILVLGVTGVVADIIMRRLGK